MSSSAPPSPPGLRRRAPTAFVDLHCHSTASDGEYPPETVVRIARDAGLAAVALTDHDTLAGVAAATTAGEALGVRVVPGCEFSVKAPWGELHALGYFLSSGHPDLEAFLDRARAARQRRGEQMVEKLQRLGVEIDRMAVATQAGDGAVGRPHVARALVAAGAVSSFEEAFWRFLGRGKPAFVEKPLPALGEVADLVHRVGGVVVAAHLGNRGTEQHLRTFQRQGLDGVEVRHPSHDAADERRLTALAGRLGLAVSGGSDWHGESEPGVNHAPLGGLAVPMEWLEDLERHRKEMT